jgi:hypothetical protein
MARRVGAIDASRPAGNMSAERLREELAKF